MIFIAKIGAKFKRRFAQSADKPADKLVKKPTAEPTIAAGFLRSKADGFKAMISFTARLMARLVFLNSLSPQKWAIDLSAEIHGLRAPGLFVFRGTVVGHRFGHVL